MEQHAHTVVSLTNESVLFDWRKGRGVANFERLCLVEEINQSSSTDVTNSHRFAWSWLLKVQVRFLAVQRYALTVRVAHRCLLVPVAIDLRRSARVRVVKLDKWTLIAIYEEISDHVICLATRRAYVRDHYAVDSGWRRWLDHVSCKSVAERNLYETLAGCGNCSRRFVQKHEYAKRFVTSAAASENIKRNSIQRHIFQTLPLHPCDSATAVSRHSSENIQLIGDVAEKSESFAAKEIVHSSDCHDAWGSSMWRRGRRFTCFVAGTGIGYCKRRDQADRCSDPQQIATQKFKSSCHTKFSP